MGGAARSPPCLSNSFDQRLYSSGAFALVADTGNQIIRRIDLNTGEITPLVGQTTSLDVEAGFSEPFDVAISPAVDLALVTNADNQPIWRIDLSTGAVMPLALSSSH